ncbi:MAG TPA: site-2 protease family protein [Acidobacteriota bacterium]|nr:site-2 protease family protein [Acidobacteriota bacterium]
MPEMPSASGEYLKPIVVSLPRAPRYHLNVLLFGLTVLSTLFWGAYLMVLHEMVRSTMGPLDFLILVLNHPGLLYKGIAYSGAIMLILLSHEMGHYLACVYYGIDATLPFFIPAPIVGTGTFGAFIRIRSPFPNKKSLFDVGLAGPIAGFVMTIPFLYFGLKWSLQVPPSATPAGSGSFGEPLIFQIFGRFLLKPDLDTYLHPMGFAAWFACLATALNLLPIAQLDGGHVSYALFGRKAFYITWIFFAGVLGLAAYGFTRSWMSGVQWLIYSVLLLGLRRLAGFRHPPTLDDDAPLGFARKVWGVIALIVFLLTFMPVTINL